MKKAEEDYVESARKKLHDMVDRGFAELKKGKTHHIEMGINFAPISSGNAFEISFAIRQIIEP